MTQVERMKVAPDTVAYADGERHKLIVEFAIPGAPTETIDVKILEDILCDGCGQPFLPCRTNQKTYRPSCRAKASRKREDDRRLAPAQRLRESA